MILNRNTVKMKICLRMQHAAGTIGLPWTYGCQGNWYHVSQTQINMKIHTFLIALSNSIWHLDKLFINLRHVCYRANVYKSKNLSVYATQRQDWKAAVSSPSCPPTQRPSHQVGSWQSTLIGQLGPLVHWKQRRQGFASQKMISISSSPCTNVPLPQWWAWAYSEQRITLILIVMPSSSSFDEDSQRI